MRVEYRMDREFRIRTRNAIRQALVAEFLRKRTLDHEAERGQSILWFGRELEDRFALEFALSLRVQCDCFNHAAEIEQHLLPGERHAAVDGHKSFGRDDVLSRMREIQLNCERHQLERFS